MALDVNRLKDLAISDTGFVFDPVTGRTFTVNETGLVVLQILKAGQESSEVARALALLGRGDGERSLARLDRRADCRRAEVAWGA